MCSFGDCQLEGLYDRPKLYYEVAQKLNKKKKEGKLCLFHFYSQFLENFKQDFIEGSKQQPSGQATNISQEKFQLLRNHYIEILFKTIVGNYEFELKLKELQDKANSQFTVQKDTTYQVFPSLWHFLYNYTYHELYRTLGETKKGTLKFLDIVFPVNNKSYDLYGLHVSQKSIVSESNIIFKEVKFLDFDELNNFLSIHTPGFDGSDPKYKLKSLGLIVSNDEKYLSSNCAIELHNVTFKKSLTINGVNSELSNCSFDILNILPSKLPNNFGSAKLDNCNLNNNIYIKANQLTILDTTAEVPIQEMSLIVPFTNLNLSNSVGKALLFENIENVNIYDISSSKFSVSHNNVQLNNAQNIQSIVSELNRVVNPHKREGYFHNVDVRNINFYDEYKDGNNSDKDNNPDNLRKINFVNCRFRDEHKLRQDGIEKNHKRLEYSYLYLRELYDGRGEHIAGNDLHYNYYEIKRKYDTNLSKIDKLMLGLYGYLNGYNTKPARSFGWLILVFLYFWGNIGMSVAYYDIIKINDVVMNTNSMYDAILSSCYIAVSGLLPTSLFGSDIKVPDLSIFSWIKIESIISSIILVFLFFAIRNRFRRSKEPVDIGK